jgi:hypothetical protein
VTHSIYNTKTLYEKDSDGNFAPVSEYLTQTFNHGTWLIVSKPGTISYQKIDPQYDLVMAVVSNIEDELTKYIVETTEGRTSGNSKETIEKFNKFCTKNKIHWIEIDSAHKIVDHIINLLQEKVEAKMTNDSIRRASEHLNLLVKLSDN